MKQVIKLEDLFLSQIFDRFSPEIQHFLQLLEHNMANEGPTHSAHFGLSDACNRNTFSFFGTQWSGRP